MLLPPSKIIIVARIVAWGSFFRTAQTLSGRTTLYHDFLVSCLARSSYPDKSCRREKEKLVARLGRILLLPNLTQRCEPEELIFRYLRLLSKEGVNTLRFHTRHAHILRTFAGKLRQE